jgi:acyl carrier protein
VEQTQSDIKMRIREILTELFPDHDITQLGDGASLAETLDIDSMAVIDVALEVERRFGVHVPDEDLERLTSIDAIAGYLDAPADR